MAAPEVVYLAHEGQGASVQRSALQGTVSACLALQGGLYLSHRRSAARTPPSGEPHVWHLAANMPPSATIAASSSASAVLTAFFAARRLFFCILRFCFHSTMTNNAALIIKAAKVACFFGKVANATFPSFFVLPLAFAPGRQNPRSAKTSGFHPF